MIDDALRDARDLRGTIEPCLDTAGLSPRAVAEWILDWLNNNEPERLATSE